MDRPVAKVLPMVVGGTLHWFVPVKYLDGRSFELVTLPDTPKWRTIDAWIGSAVQTEPPRG